MIKKLTSLIALVLLLGIYPAQASADEVSALDQKRALLDAHRSRLETLLSAQVSRITRLKQQAPGVRRDFQLRRALRDNQELATRLTRLQNKVRELNSQLLQAYDQAIGQTVDRVAKVRLLRRRAEIARRIGTRRTKIVTNERANPLDSAEDLEEKADLLKDSEEKVRRQLNRIKKQLTRLKHRSKLRRHSRAVDDSPFIESSPRRLSRSSSAGGSARKLDSDDRADPQATLGATHKETAPPAGGGSYTTTPNKKTGDVSGAFDGTNTGTPAPPPAPGRVGTVTTSPGVLVKGALDPSILQELRRARRSGNLKARLAALEKAKRKLAEIAKRLNRQSKTLRKRAKTLK